MIVSVRPSGQLAEFIRKIIRQTDVVIRIQRTRLFVAGGDHAVRRTPGYPWRPAVGEMLEHAAELGKLIGPLRLSPRVSEKRVGPNGPYWTNSPWRIHAVDTCHRSRDALRWLRELVLEFLTQYGASILISVHDPAWRDDPDLIDLGGRTFDEWVESTVNALRAVNTESDRDRRAEAYDAYLAMLGCPSGLAGDILAIAGGQTSALRLSVISRWVWSKDSTDAPEIPASLLDAMQAARDDLEQDLILDDRQTFDFWPSQRNPNDVMTCEGVEEPSVDSGPADDVEASHRVPVTRSQEATATAGAASGPNKPTREQTTANDQRLERICEALTPQQDKLLRFLWDRKFQARYDELPSDGFRNGCVPDDDNTTKKALERLRDAILMVDNKVAIEISHAKKRVKVSAMT